MSLKSVFALIISLIFVTAKAQTDFVTIYDRLYTEALQSPSDGEIQTILGTLNGNGSFTGINYSSTTADLRDHLRNLNKMASAYQNQASGYYQNSSLKQNFFTSLNYWITTNHTPTNWWYRHIAYPKEAWQSIIMMSDELKSEQNALYQSAINYLTWAYLQDNYMSGANGADKIAGAFPAYILEENTSRMNTIAQQIKDLIQTQNEGEGFEVDYMFGQHSKKGRQAYLATYGGEYFRSLMAFIRFTQDTDFGVGFGEYFLLESYFTEGVQWPIYNSKMDPTQTGRKNSNTAGVGTLKNRLGELIALNTPQKSALEVVYDRFDNGANASTHLEGNRMFWRFDYMIHRRDDYYVSSRTTSTRTVGQESGLGQGEYNFYSGSGVNYLIRTGDEYGGAYFNVFNERQFPGVTTEQDNDALPKPEWGLHGVNGDSYAGGVSNGTYGVNAMLHDRRGVRARKSWFYFENEIVALGGGINQNDGSAPIVTTLNQCVQSGDVTYSENGSVSTLNTTSTTLSNMDWVLQDGWGYVNMLDNASYTISSENRSGTTIFTATTDHGTNPSNGAYAYALLPNTNNTALSTFSQNNPIEILRNDGHIQAVRHKDLGITQIVFYNTTPLTSDHINVSVDAPCILMITESGDKIDMHIANPHGETSNPASITVTTNWEISGNGATWDGSNSSVTLLMANGDYAGSTLSLPFDRSNCPAATASEHDGNIPTNVLDKDLDTRWSANGDGQYIEFCLGDTLALTGINIAFYLGDQRTSTFDVSTSLDGVQWTSVVSNEVSSGTSLLPELFIFPETVDAWKMRITGHGNSSSDWNSITEVSWDVAPTSTNLPNNEQFFSVYPNPSNGIFTLQNTSGFDALAEIFDLSGKVVFRQMLTPGTQTLELSGISDGIFLLKVTAEDQVEVVRLNVRK